MFKRILIPVAALFMAGAAPAARVPDVPMPFGPHYPVEVVLDQQEGGVDVAATKAGAAGGGLLGALVVAALDNKKTKEAEATIVPIRDVMLAYRFNEVVEREIRARLPSPGLSPAPAFTFTASSLEQADAQNKQERAPVALVLSPRYSFDTDFTEMLVKINVRWLERTVKSSDKVKVKVLFSRDYTFHQRLADAGNDKLNAQAWAAMGGDTLGRLFDEGIRRTVAAVVYDFSQEGRAHWGTGTRKGSDESFAPAGTADGVKYTWRRSGKGLLEAFNGYDEVPRAPAAQPATP